LPENGEDNFRSIDNKKGTVARTKYNSSTSQQPTFQPEINKKSTKLAPQKAPIFSNARYQKEMEERNLKMEQLRLKRQAELQEKETREEEELAKN